MSIENEVLQRESSESEVRAIQRREVQQSESISADVVRKKLKKMDVIMFCVAFLEWAGNALGTLAFLWATVVMLGGFSSIYAEPHGFLVCHGHGFRGRLQVRSSICNQERVDDISRHTS